MQKEKLLIFFFTLLCFSSWSQESIARQWNEVVLEAIRTDFARPTVHARNLFHTSVAMYDAWAIYGNSAETYFLGKTVHGYYTPMTCEIQEVDILAAQEEAISFAAYRLIKHRFKNSPGTRVLNITMDNLMNRLGYDISNESIEYAIGPAEMGNYIAHNLINFGLQDGSNEVNDYENLFYEPINAPMLVDVSGNPNLSNFNRWQPLEFFQFVGQSNIASDDNIPEFLGPEWGAVLPFSLKEDDLNIYERNGFDYWVYHDPGPPALIDENKPGLTDNYKWGNAMVAVWSSHLSPTDTMLIDISPASLGNIQEYPTTIDELRDFYNFIDGGDYGQGHGLNPANGQAYTPNFVSRGDYGRVLAEFWADGPDSETPPGHWFTILNYVNDNPNLIKKFRGIGEELDDLEWDVKSYFMLGGAMHDAAISAWGIKGWYDYIRPVSAIRGMAELGQSSDPNLPNYHPNGLPLIPGLIELIEAGDTLQGSNQQFVGEPKIWGWLGPRAIRNPESDVAGVGWIRAKYWWPYQRPTFVTPPFAGYVSGHSTYSRAAAEVLTALTGDPFFPGGVGEFFCEKDKFLVFEDGPSKSVRLQWATYRDASDQCSLSRIWGGIHPPVDDIPGRLIGEKIGKDAFEFAEQYFEKEIPLPGGNDLLTYPNPTDCGITIELETVDDQNIPFELYHSDGRLVNKGNLNFFENRSNLSVHGLPTGVYILAGFEDDTILFKQKILVK